MVSAESTGAQEGQTKMLHRQRSRPDCESRRDNLQVTRCAYGNCARTDAPSALTPHSATALQRFPEGKQVEISV